MTTKYPLAALVLLSLVGSASRVEAQGAPAAAAAAARRQKLAAQQAAAIAAAKANATPTATPTAAATINRPVTTTTPTATPTAAPTTTPTTTTTAAPTTAPTTTAAPTATTSATAAPTTSASAAPVASATHPDTTAIALDIEALKKTRPERRHAEFVDMQNRWGALLADPRATDELKLHAQRLAYLQRIRALGAKDATFVKGVDELITKEETRSSDVLNALRSGALPVPVPVPVPAAVPAAAPAVAAPAVTGGAK